jgi:hypothetical protein
MKKPEIPNVTDPITSSQFTRPQIINRTGLQVNWDDLLDQSKPNSETQEPGLEIQRPKQTEKRKEQVYNQLLRDYLCRSRSVTVNREL